MKKQSKTSKLQKKQEEVCQQKTVQCCTEKQLRENFLLRHRLKYNFPKFQSAQIPKQQKKIDSNLLQCPLCLDVIVHSAITPCKHTFCEECLFQAFKNKAECPLCRKSLLNEALFFNAKSLDDFISSSVDLKDKEAFNERVQWSEIQRSARQVKDAENGQNVIFMCSDKRWREGLIVSVSNTENEKQITVEYKIHGNNRKDTVPSHSFRLVKKDFLKKQDIYDENSSDDDDPLGILSFFSIFPFLQIPPRQHFIRVYLFDHDDLSLSQLQEHEEQEE